MTPTPTSNLTIGRWVRYRSVAYLRGKGFSLGLGDLFPQNAQATGKYLVNIDTLKSPRTHICDEGFDVLAPTSFNYAFLGPRLTQLPNPQQLVADAASKLVIGGHLIICVPTNSATTTDLTQWVSKAGAWQLKATYLRQGLHLHIYKKLKGTRGINSPKVIHRPRACIVRYGALGDMVMLTPLIRALAKDGYEITLNVTEYAAPVLQQNPHITNLLLQEKDAIPNNELGEYWKEWSGDYDKYINLSESVEGRLLKVEGRAEFYTSKCWREETCNLNYGQYTMELGGYGPEVDRKPEIFLTNAERRFAQKIRDLHRGKFLVAWALNGSSHHKIYALVQPLLNTFLESHPNAHVILLGDSRAKDMEFDHPQVTKACSLYSLREVMALMEVVDCVVGPESAIINFASAFPTPKITLLSHSTHDNLCRDWEGDYCLAPDTSLAPCYPCHQLHYTNESCPQAMLQDEDGEVLAEGPACAMGAISMERLLARLDEVYNSKSTT